MIYITKRSVEDYENSFHTEYTISVDYKFEEGILEQYLSQAEEHCTAFLKKLTKGETNNG